MGRFNFSSEAVSPDSLLSRFAERDVMGAPQLQNGAERALEGDFTGAIDLSANRHNDLWQESRDSIRRRPKPRLFISHKSQDTSKATFLDRLARLEGFETWLDVLDPDLSGWPLNTRETPDSELGDCNHN